jgi:hypothetical protein
VKVCDNPFKGSGAALFFSFVFLYLFSFLLYLFIPIAACEESYKADIVFIGLCLSMALLDPLHQAARFYISGSLSRLHLLHK